MYAMLQLECHKQTIREESVGRFRSRRVRRGPWRLAIRLEVCVAAVAASGLLSGGALAVSASTSLPISKLLSCLPIILTPKANDRYACTLQSGGFQAGPGMGHGGNGIILEGPCRLM